MDPSSQVAHVDERHRIEELPAVASHPPVTGHDVTVGRADPVVATARHVDASSLDGPTEPSSSAAGLPHRQHFIDPLLAIGTSSTATMVDPSSTAAVRRRFEEADIEDSIDVQDVELTPPAEMKTDFAVRVLSTQPLVTVEYDAKHKEILVCKVIDFTPQAQQEIAILQSREVVKAVKDANGCLVETVEVLPWGSRVVNGVLTTRCVIKMRPCSSISLPEPASSTSGPLPPMSGDGFTLASWFVLNRASLRPEDEQACHRVFMVCFRDVAIGLKALHAQQLAHRDIKLENFVYAFEPQSSLAAFGQEETVAQWLGRHRVRAQIIDLGFVTPSFKATAPCGTLSYIPPDLYGFFAHSFRTGRQQTPTIEQLQSADMFALGIAFANVLMGKCPALKVRPGQSVVQQIIAAQAEMATRVDRYAAFLRGDGCPHEFRFLFGLVTAEYESRLTAAGDALQCVIQTLNQQQ